MTRWSGLLLTLSLTAGLRGQNTVTLEPRDQVDGLYTGMARELPNGVCHNNDCVWTLEHLLTYYSVALDDAGLNGALRDRRADVRSMAADELAKRGGKEAIPWLAAALSSETAVGTRLHLADSLAQLGDPQGMAVLETLCKSGGQSDPVAEATVRLHASLFLQQRHKTCNSCVIDLLRTLDRPEAPREFGLRATALSLTSDLESATPEQATAIREIAGRWLADEDDNVRRQASAALVLYGDGDSYHKLKAALAVERDSMTHTCMQEELRKMEGLLPGTVKK